MTEILKELYFNPAEPEAFAQRNKLSKVAQNLGNNVSRFKSEKLLRDQDVYRNPLKN